MLRYGLPLDFLPVFVEPNMKREKALKVRIVARYDHAFPARPALVVDASRPSARFLSLSLTPCVLFMAGCVD